jgi:hypothetical protein
VKPYFCFSSISKSTLKHLNGSLNTFGPEQQITDTHDRMQRKIVWFLATWLLNSFVFTNLAVASSSEKSSKISNKEAYAELKKTIASVRKSCGEVCDQTITGKPGKYFDEITKNIDCPGLFSEVGMDLPSQFESAPARIPKWLSDDFGYHGKVELLEDYRDNSKGQDHWHFTKEVIERIQNELDNNTFIGKRIILNQKIDELKLINNYLKSL